MFGTQRFVVNRQLTAAKIYDDEAIVINTATGRYYDLEGAGADVWGLLVDGVSVPQAAAVLASRYEVDADKAASDVHSFLERLVSEQLVVEATEPEREPRPVPTVEQRTRYLAPSVTTFTDMEELLAADPPMPAQYTPVWGSPPAGGA
jgi:hypothetical protein